MNLLTELWNDEAGLVLSAETVTLGTVGVLGSIVGLNAAGGAINGEMKEWASAIRSLDQSYAYVGHRSCGAWTASSCYIQPDKQQALAEINEQAVDVRSVQQKVEDEIKARQTPVAEPLPNQIPKTDAKSDATPETVPAK